MLGLEVVHVRELHHLKPCLKLARGMQVGSGLLPDLHKGLLDLHGVETIQGVSHSDAAVEAAVPSGYCPQPVVQTRRL